MGGETVGSERIEGEINLRWRRSSEEEDEGGSGARQRDEWRRSREEEEDPRSEGAVGLGKEMGKIVSVNENRHTILFDTLTSGALAGPHLRHAIGGKLYLTSMFPENHGTPCFEALRYDNELEDWLWDLLPSPSLFDMPFGDGSIIHCFASGHDKNIWISTLGNGTHIFDTTTTTTWHKVGGWALPFEGRVQYVPEYRQCFGFSERSSKLCSADLIFGSRILEPPAYRNVWDDVDGYMGTQWHLARSYLTYLGCGKFCITRFYDTRNDWEDDYIPVCNVAVMTAVEVRCDSNTGHLEMIKGASRCYKFSPDTLYGWVL
ncbi:hypothetical protein BRADI_1g75384v3 [Brachypodium distachyon]|uniref:Uncharacterized protein n=1 Tax=Brachypodium distachyon TaxID=15368 RepID=A0A2K2DVB4_BRADI|nr:hypothetical protein BRADI_1g75384v3 [Brachypodium distachyon]